jgi:HK97 family phage major capsid protein
MFNIKQLRQRKADALAKADAISKAAADANRDLTDQERLDYKSHMASVETLNGDIKLAEARMDEERNAPATGVTSVALPEGSKKPWANKGEFLVAIARGQKHVNDGRASLVDPRILGALGSSESVPAEGGFTVPPEFSNDLLQRVYDTGEVAKRCRQLTMTSSRLIINAIDEDSRGDGSRYGGILAYWTYEAAPYQGTKPKFREIQLAANKLTGLTYATEELLEDSTAFSTYIDAVFPQEFAFKLDAAVFSGPGAGAPQGFQNSGALIVQAKDAGQATGTVSTNNILNMWSRVWAPSRKTGVWYINQAVEPELYPLTLGSPSLGQILLYTPPGMYGNNSGYGLLMGRPVVPIEQASNLSTQGDITFADGDQYLLAKRTDLTQDSSMHVAFLTGEMAFRWQMRIDGQTWWKKPLQPYQSAAPTLSPFVTLQTR